VEGTDDEPAFVLMAVGWKAPTAERAKRDTDPVVSSSLSCRVTLPLNRESDGLLRKMSRGASPALVDFEESAMVGKMK